jgi:hypothetical protein
VLLRADMYLFLRCASYYHHTVLLQDVFPPPSPLGAAADAACPLRQRARSDFLRTVNELGQVSHPVDSVVILS